MPLLSSCLKCSLEISNRPWLYRNIAFFKRMRV